MAVTHFCRYATQVYSRLASVLGIYALPSSAGEEEEDKWDEGGMVKAFSWKSCLQNDKQGLGSALTC